MAKKKVQQVETEVEITSPDVETKTKKHTKVEKDNAKQKKTAQKKHRKSVKKQASEIWSELKKVSKPSFGKVCKNTCVVIAVVSICTLLLFGVDKLFSLFNNLLMP